MLVDGFVLAFDRFVSGFDGFVCAFDESYKPNPAPQVAHGLRG